MIVSGRGHHGRRSCKCRSEDCELGGEEIMDGAREDPDTEMGRSSVVSEREARSPQTSGRRNDIICIKFPSVCMCVCRFNCLINIWYRIIVEAGRPAQRLLSYSKNHGLVDGGTYL